MLPPAPSLPPARAAHAGADGVDVAHPVNVLAFHPTFGTFASGGCDGVVNAWDGNAKKRLCQWTEYPSSIASLAFAADGRRVAIASSYTFEHGERPHGPPDQIYIRELAEGELMAKPKGKSSSARALGAGAPKPALRGANAVGAVGA
jgi:WD40 repeat protein